jgi:hypothetical protein
MTTSSPLDNLPAVSETGFDVARLFHRALSLIFLIAWISLGLQVRLLIGRRGLLPVSDFVDAARDQGVLSILNFPSALALAPGDASIVAGIWIGVALALLGIAGAWPRLCAFLQAALYLGYALACRAFLGFQWDNLLLECALLATFLPVHRRAPLTRLLFLALIFKLYFESGIAKWQSPLHDWRDGSAMTFYYQTAPLPTALAWYAHHLPRWWHLFESRATLFVELVVPFAVFGPRRARKIAAATFTLFQIINAATANYGFFCYLAIALHVFLLDNRDIVRVRAWAPLSRASKIFAATVRNIVSRADAIAAGLCKRLPARPKGAKRASAVAGAATWILVSLIQAWFHFGEPGPAVTATLMPVLEISQTFRVVNTYHLFAAVTRQRVEPELQIQVGGLWRARDLRYKPGEVSSAPPFVAPHQPRVDFLLWFYGLAYERRQPTYVAALLTRLCEDPAAVESLFSKPAPVPDAVRLVFWDYQFTSRSEKRATGNWWTRRQVGETQPFACGR